MPAVVTLIEPGALACALVRLGESFLSADVLAARKPDVATANRLRQALVEGILPEHAAGILPQQDARHIRVRREP